MIRVPELLAVASAELRLARRLVRYWVFFALSYLVGVAFFLYYALLHMLGSSWSATAATIGPRYLMSAVGTYAVLVFLIGVVFLGFDLRARDRRERMVEVLDARPFTNLELVSGRFLGLLTACWVPMVGLAVVVELLGFLLEALGAPLGEPVEPWSLVALVSFMALPALAFTLALVFAVSLAVRNRLVASVLLLALLGGSMWLSFRIPVRLVPLLDLTGGFGLNFPSDLIPAIADGPGWLQRLGVLVAAVGLVALAAAIHPRLDGGSRGRTAMAAVALLVTGGLLVGGVVVMRTVDLHQLESWRDAHLARRDDPAPEVESIRGTATLDPGRSLGLDLQVTVRAPSGGPLDPLLFTLNPGLQVQWIRGPGGSDLVHSHRDGLLEVRLAQPLQPGEALELEMSIRGRPDLRFGYLDSSLILQSLTLRDASVFLLGDLRGVFDRRYAALMPGIRWLPAPGADVGRDDPRRRAPDFFDVDLEVEVPRGFLVAGPGRRQELGSEGKRARFRFTPGAPVPEVALLAARFESRSVEVEGVRLELLVDPDHTDNLELLADAAGEIERAIGDRLREARDLGLGYPYDGLTMVEVPSRLRGYGGGWRLDTALAQPGLVLVRENAFPTARFDFPFRNPEEFRDREGGVPRAKLERLRSHFVNDFSGGNVLMNASRAFVLDQTRAAGPEGVAVDFVLETLATRVVTDTRGYFSVHVFDSDLNQSIQRAFVSFFVGGRQDREFADAVIEAFTSRSEVWEAVLGVALADLDPAQDPQRTVDVLTLKAGALAESLADFLGRERVGRLLATLVERHRGQPFDRSDLVAAGQAVDADLEPLLATWLNSTDLPGFVGAGARAYRLPDGEDGSPRYQLLVGLANEEPASGMLRVVVTVGSGREAERDSSDPITLDPHSAVEYGTVLSQAPTAVEVRPYLSLNRAPFALDLAEVNEAEAVDLPPFEGVREAPTAPPPADRIVVDDLDPGFAVAGDSRPSGLRLGARGASSDTDQGLPSIVVPTPPAQWSRFEAAEAWGTYRHTVALVRPGRGDQRAVFTVTLPRAGSWDLELHLPDKSRFRPFIQKWGAWHLELVTSEGSQEVTFDSVAAGGGWNLVGTYDLPAGEVRLELTDRTDGQLVVADAIRLQPAAGGGS